MRSRLLNSPVRRVPVALRFLNGLTQLRSRSALNHVAALSLFALITGVVCSRAFGLGAGYGPGELKYQGAIAGQKPVRGYWVNWTDMFYYAGDAQAFNEFIKAYSEVKEYRTKLAIHRGVKTADSPWKQHDEPADWSLYVWNTGTASLAKVSTTENGETKVMFAPPQRTKPTQVDVWIGQRLKLEDIRIPPGLEVTAGADSAQDAEIQKLIADRKAPPAAIEAAVVAETAARIFRLTLELTDGSRLLGEATNVRDLPVQASFGKVSIPLELVASIEFSAEHDAVTIQFRNGDRLTGALSPDWGELTIRTAIGELTVPTRTIRACAIEAVAHKASVRARAKSSWETSTPEKAFDGRVDTGWNAGDYAPAWIEAELARPALLASIVLVPCQDIVGATMHEVWVSDEPIGEDRKKALLVHTFQGETHDHARLRFDFPKGLTARYVQVRTTQSPTWISWWEVQLTEIAN